MPPPRAPAPPVPMQRLRHPDRGGRVARDGNMLGCTALHCTALRCKDQKHRITRNEPTSYRSCGWQLTREPRRLKADECANDLALDAFRLRHEQRRHALDVCLHATPCVRSYLYSAWPRFGSLLLLRVSPLNRRRLAVQEAIVKLLVESIDFLPPPVVSQ